MIILTIPSFQREDIPDIACNPRRKLVALNSVYRGSSYELLDCSGFPTSKRKAKWEKSNESLPSYFSINFQKNFDIGHIESLSFDSQGTKIVTIDGNGVVLITNVDKDENYLQKIQVGKGSSKLNEFIHISDNKFTMNSLVESLQME